MGLTSLEIAPICELHLQKQVNIYVFDIKMVTVLNSLMRECQQFKKGNYPNTFLCYIENIYRGWARLKES